MTPATRRRLHGPLAAGACFLPLVAYLAWPYLPYESGTPRPRSA